MGCFYFLASFLFTSCLVLGAEPPTKYVLKGTGESLKPTFSGQPNSILWKHNGNKVVEFDSREEQVYGAYKNRITLDWVSAELEITGLKFEDRGLYEVEVDINNMLHLSEFKLEVIDKVAMPTISCEINKDGGSDVSEVRATLLCSADPTPPESMMKFEWRARGKSQPGHKFNISLGDERDNEEYRCSVSNPVSSETATFTAKYCYHDNSSVAVAVSLAVVGLIGLIVLGLIIIFCKKRQKACFAKGQQDDEEKQTEGSDKKKAQGGETRHLLAETPLSDQRLSVSYSPEPVVDTEPRKGFVKKAIHNIEKGKKPQQPQSITETLSPPASPFGNLISPRLHADFDRGDTDADVMNLSGEEKISQPEHSNSEETKEPECVGLSDESEQPEKNQGGGEEASPVPPTDQTSPDDKLSQDEDLKDPAGGQKNGSDSEEVNEDAQDESVSQTDSSACFAKGQQDDEEKQTEGSDKKKAQGGETRPLLTETLLSDQRLSVSYSPEPVVDTEPRKGFVKKAIHNIEKGKKPQQPQSITETLSPPTSPFGNLISPSLHADFDRGDTDADVMNLSGEEKISQPEHSNSEETKEPECVGLSDESEQPEKNQGGGEEASPVPPTDQSSPTLANSSSPKTEGGPDEDPEDPAGGQKNGSDSDERNKDTQDESVSQTDSSACFAKGQQDDEEKQTEGSDKKKAQGGETRHLLAETLLSDQPLNVSYSPVNVKKMAGEINRRAGQEPVGDKKPRKGNLKEKEDNIEKGEKPQQTKNITEPEKNQGGGEEASPVPPTDQTSPTLANSSPPKTERGPDEDPEDPAGGQKNGSDSDEDYEDTQDESVSQTDSSGTQQNRNESDKSSVNKSSSVPHEEGSNTTSQERESATPKEEESTEEAKPVKPVPPAEETSNLMSNGEEIDEKQHLADSTEVNTSNTLTLRLQTLHMQIQSLRGRAGRTQVRGGGQAEADQGEGGNDEDKEEDQGGPEDEKSDDEW
ncbi:nucleolar and coiled-body phosphoprotein 1 isoform X19 [Labrus bergylta]|uniref:nucleolar and coiled-body phosphoprotein 1 isoform X19 n=1 Tax=Labrus bergylta TaxID=56723 RepID=UPI00331342E1